MKIVMCVLLWATVAQAQDLKSLYRDVSAAYRARDYGRVIALYEQARVRPSAHRGSRYLIPAWWHYAIALHDAGRACEARTQYLALVDFGAVNRQAKMAGLLETRMQRVAADVSGSVIVECARLPVTVQVGGVRVEGCGVELLGVRPGVHIPQVVLGGVEYPRRELVVRPCASTRLAIPPPGSVHFLDAPARATVYLGERRLGPASAPIRLPPGTYALTLRGPGLEPQTRRATVHSGRTQRLSASRSAPSQGDRTLPWIALATSAAVAGVGGYLLWVHVDDTNAQLRAQYHYDSEVVSSARAAELRAELIAAGRRADDSGELAAIVGGIGLAGLTAAGLWLLLGGDGPGRPGAGLRLDGGRMTWGIDW